MSHFKIAPKYFFSEAFLEKIFQIKVVWVEGGHKRVPHGTYLRNDRKMKESTKDIPSRLHSRISKILTSFTRITYCIEL